MFNQWLGDIDPYWLFVLDYIHPINVGNSADLGREVDMDEEYEAEDELEDVEAAYWEMDEIMAHLLKGEYEFHFVSYFDIKQALFYPTTAPTPPNTTLLTLDFSLFNRGW